jgi:hypothetical protein
LNNEITDTLQERGASYGDYNAKTAFIQYMKDEMRHAPTWATMHDGGREALDMIATKIGRLLYGDPQHEDSWLDIGGYAMLGKGFDTVAPAAQECMHYNTYADSSSFDIVCCDCGASLDANA